MIQLSVYEIMDNFMLVGHNQTIFRKPRLFRRFKNHFSIKNPGI